ncbi:MAG: NFACT family protein, partial [Acidobacteriota bacterium]|nr:NFACT family protein [Acidobacteriota bacterium]
MDNLVLIRVVSDLSRVLSRAVLKAMRSDGPHRYSLRFEKGERGFTVAISLRPELPWLGRPVVRRKRGTGRSDPFVGTCTRALVGGIVESIEKPGFDRVVVFGFSRGPALVAELATHKANLILLGSHREVVACARHPRSSRQRLAPGASYEPPTLPGRLLLPEDAGSVDARVEEAIAEGETSFEAIRRRIFGVGSAGATLIDGESRRTGKSVGTVLIERLEGIRAGRLDPVIEAEADPLELARE